MGKSWETIEKPNFIGRKYIDKSLFKYGIHIPTEYIPKFLNNIHGNTVELGKSKEIKLIFDDYECECSIRNVDRKGVTSQTIQIRYDGNSQLKEYLKNKFSYTYNLIENEEEIDTDEYIDIYKANELNTFYIKENTHKNLELHKNVIDFINTIKSTSMSKSYKIPLLWSFYNNGNIKLKINEDDIYNSFKEFYSKNENSKDLQNQKNTLGYENWGKKEYIKLAKDNPIKYLADKTSKYFYKENDLFCISGILEPYIHKKEFIQEFKDAIQSLENRYFKRNNSINEDDNKYMELIEEIIPADIINKVESYIKNQGYNYTYNQLSNLYLSLKTKPFTILAGISGTGKSKIIRLLADSINADYTLISVRPDWNDSTDLIGYKNLDDKFIKGQLTKTILKAKENKNKIYFICLDEMNLARVEYYLSDYLSIIESRKKVGQDIITDNIVEYQEDNENISLHIPDNLYLIGTVNMDDTTFQFSRKVLDRANTIEFSDVDLDNLFFENNEEKVESLNVSNDFLKTTYLKTMDIEPGYREYAKEVNKKIIEINEILKKSQNQFAYRVRDEILFYMIENKKADLLDEDTAFDYQIMQKILPAINGSEQSVYKVLIDLLNFIFETNDIETVEEAENHLETTTVKYENSAKKIIYMLKGYQNDGYVSYWY
ncbi:MAG: AAA family ATPase [Romboutsia timonensis]|uniref:McrB family protein n=1 Tax=Romboutsia timonensis TaxID=1776391 RepID=UPI002A74E2E4|nr:AAA family ATPase [Romboutsia timonensis]MDY3002353.1 AAA family ATPase [Romboutsia timonensis]